MTKKPKKTRQEHRVEKTEERERGQREKERESVSARARELSGCRNKDWGILKASRHNKVALPWVEGIQDGRCQVSGLN